MDLQVLSAPTNQPTLNPQVQSAPVQPTLAPRVVQAPQQPVLAPRVVTQPSQPSLNPTVQTQPQGFGNITSVGPVGNQQPFTAKLSLFDFGQLIKQQYPQYASKDNQTLALAMLKKYPQYTDRIIQPSSQSQGETGFKGLALGVAKGAFGTLKNLTKLTSSVLTPGLTPAVSKTLDTLIPTENLQAHGTAENIGKIGEQIAEFFIPAGAVAEAGKATEAGIDALKFGKTATSALKLGARSAIGAGEAAGITAVQGGNTKDIKTAGVVGAVFPAIAKALDFIVQKVPETAWSSILKRTSVDVAKNPKLPAQAAKTGLTGLSRQAIANKAEKAIQSIEVSLDDLLSNSKGTISTAKVAGYLNGVRGAYASIPGEENSVKVIDSIASQLLERFKKGESMTPLEANQLKRDIYQVIAKSYGRGVFEIPAKTEAQKLVALGLKQEIERVIPEAKTLNQKQAVYLQIKKALDKTIARSQGKGLAGTGVGLYDLLTGGIAETAGLATGPPLAGLGAIAVKKGAESPAVLSSVSKLFNFFNQLSPTKKLLFYQALKGLTVKGATGVSGSFGAQKTTQ